MGLFEAQRPEIKKYKGKFYIYKESDCFTLIRDFYKNELSIEIPNYEYDENWWHTGANLYIENMEDAGFEKVELENIIPNDIILIRLGTKDPCHAAIYLGCEKILHHVVNRLSTVEDFSGYWHLNAVCAARYKNEPRETSNKN